MDAMKESKSFKYTLYAVGEIFLIIVGILIAVQINDWNENRKEKKAKDMRPQPKKPNYIKKIQQEGNPKNIRVIHGT